MKVSTIYFVLFLPIILKIVNGDNEKISPKLDFDESNEENNSSQRFPNSGGKSTKFSPKIQGVRVTVDTGKAKKQSTDGGSKESVEIVETKNKKKVEIHTDITVEISDGDLNSTSSETGKGEFDASVPIFKGRRPSTRKPQKPYDPRQNPWVPARPHDGAIHPHAVIPVYPRTNDEGIYRSIDNWNNFVPITRVWTTERTYYPPRSYDHLSDIRNYQPYSENTQWRPCYCISTIHRGFKNSPEHKKIKINDVIKSVNGKLGNPFSNRK